MKRCLLVLAVVVAASLTRAEGFYCDDFYQPYVGIVGGLSALDVYSQSHDVTTEENHFSHTGGLTGLIGGVGGVQLNFYSCYFFAIQANALYSGQSDRIRSDTDTAGVTNYIVNLKNHFQWGLDGRLGIGYYNITPYLLAGFETGKWTLALRNRSGTSSRGIPAHSTITKSRTLWGPKVGAGVTFPFFCHLEANFEYSYTWFGKITRMLTDTSGEWHHKENIRQNSFLIGVNYLF